MTPTHIYSTSLEDSLLRDRAPGKAATHPGVPSGTFVIEPESCPPVAVSVPVSGGSSETIEVPSENHRPSDGGAL